MKKILYETDGTFGGDIADTQQPSITISIEKMFYNYEKWFDENNFYDKYEMLKVYMVKNNYQIIKK